MAQVGRGEGGNPGDLDGSSPLTKDTNEARGRMSTVSLGYSPTPNDTFIFFGLVHGRAGKMPPFRLVLKDIETLNRLALERRIEVTRGSFHALAHLRPHYCLLHAGGALGRGCGPLVVASEPPAAGDLEGKKIAVPGKLTTAALLLRLFNPGLKDLVVLPFNQIMPAVQAGAVDAGVIIHENRFTYLAYGLRQVVDLGEWWEKTSGHAIPLGGILARRDLGKRLIRRLDHALRRSVEYAHDYPEEVRQYIREQAPEMDEKVMEEHLDLYVNEHTSDYGADGEAAIGDLLSRAEEAGIAPPSDLPLFYPPSSI